MAKNPTPLRAAVTLSGVALLAAIASSENGFMMLTQAEGADIVNQGFAVVDTAIVEGDTAAVRLTEAGSAEVAKANAPAANEAAPAAVAAVSGFAIDTDVPLPTGSAGGSRGRAGGYPFDALQVNGSFHVAATAETPNPESKLASSVSGARAKYAEEIAGETEERVVKTYKRGEDGKYLKDADGKRIVESETTETRPKTRITRDFIVKKVDETDPRGPGARVWRVA